MAFADEQIKASGARLYYIVHLALDSGNKYYAIPQHKADTIEYKGRLLSADGLSRKIDVINADVQTSEAKVILIDNDEEIAKIFANEALIGKVGTVSIGFKDDTGTLFTDNVFSGTLERRQSTTTQQEVAIIPKLREAIGILQRSVTEAAFPSAPGSTLGQGLNIVLGDVDSINRDNGAVYCPIVDTTNRYVAVAQHACKLADNFIKVKGDTITNITPSAISYTATDAESKTYTRATIGVGDWDEDALYYCDCQGLETAGDGTGSIIYNPALLIEKVITDFSDLTASDINTTAFDTFETLMTTRGYDTAGEWGGVIPWNPGEVLDDPTEILSQLAFNCGGALFVDGDGKISIVDTDISETESDTSTLTLIEEKDLTRVNARLNRAPFTILNKTRAPYKWAHKIASGEKAIIAEDEGSVSNYGETKENETLLYFVRGTDTVEDLLTRYLLKRGGNPQIVSLPMSGLHKHGVEVGDTILLTHNHVNNDFNEKQLKVITVDTFIPQFNGRASAYDHTFETFTGVTRANVFGPVSFSGEETTEFQASDDTYVAAIAGSTNYGTETTMWHGNPGFGEGINRRRFGVKFDISAVGVAGGTVESASLQLYVTLSFNPSALQLRELTNPGTAPEWTEASSTWNTFRDGVGWDDALNIGSTLLASDPGAGGTGYKSFVFNSSGITYIENNKNGDVHFTLQDMNRGESYYFATSEHATSAFQPRLIINFTK